MLRLLMTICMVYGFIKLFPVAMRASWGLGKILLVFILAPVILGFAIWMLSLVLPVLLILFGILAFSRWADMQ